MGTGENDYALLILTERTSASAPDVPLVYLEPSARNPQIGDEITLAGYPAGFGDVNLLESALYLLQKPSQIINVVGFSGSGADVLNTSPTSLAVQGSSGGAIVASDDTLFGIMVAVTVDNSTGQKNIQGITLPYIQRSILSNSGKSFSYFIDNAHAEADNFEKNKAQALSSLLMQNL